MYYIRLVAGLPMYIRIGVSLVSLQEVINKGSIANKLSVDDYSDSNHNLHRLSVLGTSERRAETLKPW